ncbi:type II CAAX endopeptidase family protein [Dyella sp.]|uniref:CPBP family intramembrane glutamic endopeptidase n=1 Tax=Dyella sp. TaxID=1869338 RepID=UPI002ED49056
MDTDIALPSPPYAAPPPLPRAGSELEAPRGWAALAMLVGYFGLQILVAAIIALVVGMVFAIGHHGLSAAESSAQVKALLKQTDIRVLLIGGSLLGASALIVLLVRRQWPQLWRVATPPGLGMTMPAQTSYLATALLVGLILPFVGGMITKLLSQGHDVPQDIKQLGALASPWSKCILAGVAVLIAPVVEEILFRGVLLSAWLKRLPTGWAVAATSTVFALIHLPDLSFLWYGLPNLALLGVAFAWLRLKSGSLYPAMLAHAMNNLVTIGVWFAIASQQT